MSIEAITSFDKEAALKRIAQLGGAMVLRPDALEERFRRGRFLQDMGKIPATKNGIKEPDLRPTPHLLATEFIIRAADEPPRHKEHMASLIGHLLGEHGGIEKAGEQSELPLQLNGTAFSDAYSVFRDVVYDFHRGMFDTLLDKTQNVAAAAILSASQQPQLQEAV